MYSLTIKHGQFPILNGGVNSRKIKLPDKSLQLKEGLIPGFYKKITLENQIQCLCSKYNSCEDFHLYKIPLTHEFFVLRIDEILHHPNSVVPGRKYNADKDQKSQSVLLLSSLEEFTFFASKNSQVKTLEILIPCRWFLGQLNMDCSYELLKRYMAVKARNALVNCSNHLFRNLFIKIIREANKEVPDNNCIREKVNSLLAIFFSDISFNLIDFLESEKVRISKDEINRLMTVRKYLDTDLPPPTFASLTKIALMSSTSLKTKFKKMYGATIFEYFQSMRMQKARILLLTHKYSVKQIGHHLGYSNMSNFTIAFKKEFNQLPHLLIK
jgi:AraC-like DNA-binding protein